MNIHILYINTDIKEICICGIPFTKDKNRAYSGAKPISLTGCESFFVGNLYYSNEVFAVSEPEASECFLDPQGNLYLLKEFVDFCQRPTDDPQWMTDLYEEKLRRLKEQNLV
jgi:hypothetical protein